MITLIAPIISGHASRRADGRAVPTGSLTTSKAGQQDARTDQQGLETVPVHAVLLSLGTRQRTSAFSSC